MGDEGQHGGLLDGRVGDGDVVGRESWEVGRWGGGELKLFLLLPFFSKSLFFLGLRVGVLWVLSLVFEGFGTLVLGVVEVSDGILWEEGWL